MWKRLAIISVLCNGLMLGWIALSRAPTRVVVEGELAAPMDFFWQSVDDVTTRTLWIEPPGKQRQICRLPTIDNLLDDPRNVGGAPNAIVRVEMETEATGGKLPTCGRISVVRWGFIPTPK